MVVKLPPEMAGLDVQYLRRVSDKELSSSCPNCGGVVHQNGEWPDRFRIFLKSKYTHNIMGWCRRCGFTWHPVGIKMSADQRQHWIEEQRKVEERRRSEAEHALQLLNSERAWISYHERATGEVRHYYYDRGIPDFWIDFWSLGYMDAKVVGTKNGLWTTPSLTIPIFEPVTKRVLNIKHRLLNPPSPHDKYRPETSGLSSPIFVANYELDLDESVFVVEGEFKAMTTYIAIDDPNLNVVGIPSKSPSESVINQLSNSEKITVCLDPDAYEYQKDGESPVDRFVRLLGRQVFVMSLPYKIDDMITEGLLDKESLKKIMASARKYG